MPRASHSPAIRAVGVTDLANAPRDAVKMEFARRLQRAIVEKGWTQSELARRASKFMPKEFGNKEEGGMIRDNISKYIRAKALPSSIHLNALAKALGTKSEELLPSRGVDSNTDAIAFDMRDIGEGKVWLRINQSVPMTVAIKIATLLNDA